MGSVFSAPKPPEPKPVEPIDTDESVKKASARERERARKRKGLQSTILAGARDQMGMTLGQGGSL